jgi:hypothetical protein
MSPPSARRPAAADPPPQRRTGPDFVPVDAEPEHPLAGLDSRRLDGMRLRVFLGPTSRFGARYFRIFLESDAGTTSVQPAVTGLHHSGPYPAYNWIEVAELNQRPELPGAQDAPGRTLDLGEGPALGRLFALLAELIPPGGHMMVEYDSPQHALTVRSLARGVPPVATPLGALLLAAGCGASFKDWSIAEGGREGPRKLQGAKPLHDGDARAKAASMAHELLAYLNGPPDPAHGDLERSARRRALAALAALRVDDADVAARIRDAVQRASP